MSLLNKRNKKKVQQIFQERKGYIWDEKDANEFVGELRNGWDHLSTWGGMDIEEGMIEQKLPKPARVISNFFREGLEGMKEEVPDPLKPLGKLGQKIGKWAITPVGNEFGVQNFQETINKVAYDAVGSTEWDNEAEAREALLSKIGKAEGLKKPAQDLAETFVYTRSISEAIEEDPQLIRPLQGGKAVLAYSPTPSAMEVVTDEIYEEKKDEFKAVKNRLKSRTGPVGEELENELRYTDANDLGEIATRDWYPQSRLPMAKKDFKTVQTRKLNRDLTQLLSEKVQQFKGGYVPGENDVSAKLKEHSPYIFTIPDRRGERSIRDRIKKKDFTIPERVWNTVMGLLGGGKLKREEREFDRPQLRALGASFWQACKPSVEYDKRLWEWAPSKPEWEKRAEKIQNSAMRRIADTATTIVDRWNFMEERKGGRRVTASEFRPKAEKNLNIFLDEMTPYWANQSGRLAKRGIGQELGQNRIRKFNEKVKKFAENHREEFFFDPTAFGKNLRNYSKAMNQYMTHGYLPVEGASAALSKIFDIETKMQREKEKSRMELLEDAPMEKREALESYMVLSGDYLSPNKIERILEGEEEIPVYGGYSEGDHQEGEKKFSLGLG